MKRQIVAVLTVVSLLMGTVILAQEMGGKPAAMKHMAPRAGAGDVMATAMGDTTLTLWVKHVKKSHLESSLQGKGSVTIFAPDNKAFNARTKEDMDAEHADSTILISTIQYHILSGKTLRAADLRSMNGQMLTMDNGLKLPVVVKGQDIMVGNAHVVNADIPATNGVIHVIDRVEIPGKVASLSNAPAPMAK
jgi:uncharacterized surface protein with fasciclin (FAS1) repeats